MTTYDKLQALSLADLHALQQILFDHRADEGLRRLVRDIIRSKIKSITGIDL